MLFGQLQPYKGVEELFDVWGTVQTQCPVVRPVIAGGGGKGYLKRIQQLIQGHGLQKSVTFDPGWIDEDAMLAYHAASDILVYSYRGITQSGALLAGMRHGKPIVAALIPGFRETREDGKAGSLVPPSDSAKLAAALINLIVDEDSRKRQGVEVRGHWEQQVSSGFSGDFVVRCTMECCWSLA